MSFAMQSVSAPDRVQVYENNTWVATFTPGCYTVTTAGPERVFSEKYRHGGQTIAVRVRHSVWVRAAPGRVDDEIDERWLRLALDANVGNVADALAIAMQYIKGATAVYLGDLQIAGDAAYGPAAPGALPEEGSDFNDYLGLRWLYPDDAPDAPENTQRRCLDCSGYMRMVWGYRQHLPGSGYTDSVPLSRRLKHGAALPRRAVQMYESAPGLILHADTGTQLTDFAGIDVGDVVFFNRDPGDGPALDHVGMYLGVDTDGHHRFVSSRKRPDGPTFADRFGPSLLDGDAKYAQAFRAVRRL
jgi:cell wall-associated NlpC family hydrolase